MFATSVGGGAIWWTLTRHGVYCTWNCVIHAWVVCIPCKALYKCSALHGNWRDTLTCFWPRNIVKRGILLRECPSVCLSVRPFVTLLSQTWTVQESKYALHHTLERCLYNVSQKQRATVLRRKFRQVTIRVRVFEPQCSFLRPNFELLSIGRSPRTNALKRGIQAVDKEK